MPADSDVNERRNQPTSIPSLSSRGNQPWGTAPERPYDTGWKSIERDALAKGWYTLPSAFSEFDPLVWSSSYR
jgi:hypothetical protein